MVPDLPTRISSLFPIPMVLDLPKRIWSLFPIPMVPDTRKSAVKVWCTLLTLVQLSSSFAFNPVRCVFTKPTRMSASFGVTCSTTVDGRLKTSVACLLSDAVLSMIGETIMLGISLKGGSNASLIPPVTWSLTLISTKSPSPAITLNCLPLLNAVPVVTPLEVFVLSGSTT